MSTEDRPSRLLVEQRIRNRIIEYLELGTPDSLKERLRDEVLAEAVTL